MEVDANVELPSFVNLIMYLLCEKNKTLFTSEYQYLIIGIAFQLIFLLVYSKALSLPSVLPSKMALSLNDYQKIVCQCVSTRVNKSIPPLASTPCHL